MLDGPFQFLNCDENFSEAGINSSLSRIQTCCSGNWFLVFEDKFEESLQDFSSLGEIGGSPEFLSFLSASNGPIDAIWG